jgi:hypothetical protein
MRVKIRGIYHQRTQKKSDAGDMMVIEGIKYLIHSNLPNQLHKCYKLENLPTILGLKY